jgi:hypothetical protein
MSSCGLHLLGTKYSLQLIVGKKSLRFWLGAFILRGESYDGFLYGCLDRRDVAPSDDMAVKGGCDVWLQYCRLDIHSRCLGSYIRLCLGQRYAQEAITEAVAYAW